MRLLLTVTGEDEVTTALEAGADLVDVKDPARGSLGPPAPEVLAGVADRVDGRAPLGVPLGDGPHRPDRLAGRVEAAVEAGASYLKVGLLERVPGPASGAGDRAGGAGSSRDAGETLAAARRAVDAAGGGCVLVAVTFADAAEGTAPDPEEALETAAASGADGVMLDTLGKGDGSVIDGPGLRRLGRWCRAARAGGLVTALAGGLDVDAVRRLGALEPDVVGVRGAACTGGRAGRLDPARCRALRRAADRAPARPGDGGAGPGWTRETAAGGP